MSEVRLHLGDWSRVSVTAKRLRMQAYYADIENQLELPNELIQNGLL